MVGGMKQSDTVRNDAFTPQPLGLKAMPRTVGQWQHLLTGTD